MEVTSSVWSRPARQECYHRAGIRVVGSQLEPYSVGHHRCRDVEPRTTPCLSLSQVLDSFGHISRVGDCETVGYLFRPNSPSMKLDPLTSLGSGVSEGE